MFRLIRLVLADDSLHARKGLKAMLSAQPGMIVVGEASNGKEALALVEEFHPDIALLDVRMPVLDGLQAGREIKDRWPEIRVVLISMYAEYQEEAVISGADAFLVKGCSPEYLVQLILGVDRPN